MLLLLYLVLDGDAGVLWVGDNGFTIDLGVCCRIADFRGFRVLNSESRIFTDFADFAEKTSAIFTFLSGETYYENSFVGRVFNPDCKYNQSW